LGGQEDDVTLGMIIGMLLLAIGRLYTAESVSFSGCSIGGKKSLTMLDHYPILGSSRPARAAD
jgi:hypothetical protein